MAEVVNLRQMRKAAARAAARAKADQNAALHGRTRAEKQIERARTEKADRDLDGHARDRPDD
jgi:chorismate mutase